MRRASEDLTSHRVQPLGEQVAQGVRVNYRARFQTERGQTLTFPVARRFHTRLSRGV